MSSEGILPKVAAQAKKHTFVGALDFQIDLAGKSQPSTSSNGVEQKLLTVKEPLKWPHNLIITLGQNLFINKYG